MNLESKLSGHWTDDELIAYLYGVGPEDNHTATCVQCGQRLADIQRARRCVENQRSPGEDISFDLLAAQRRKIYSRIEQPSRWWSAFRVAGVFTAAAVIVLTGAVAVWQEAHDAAARHQAEMAKISDAQLAIEVGQIADCPEPSATQPLKALFEE
jgi:hypothetical protein